MISWVFTVDSSCEVLVIVKNALKLRVLRDMDANVPMSGKALWVISKHSTAFTTQLFLSHLSVVLKRWLIERQVSCMHIITPSLSLPFFFFFNQFVGKMSEV